MLKMVAGDLEELDAELIRSDVQDIVAYFGRDEVDEYIETFGCASYFDEFLQLAG